MNRVKILNLITGGLISDGITNSWLTFCKEFNNNTPNCSLQMEFACIEEKSSEEMENFFNKEGYRTPNLPSRWNHTLKYLFSLYKLLRKEEYDIIHVNGSSSLIIIEIFIAWIAGVKVRIAHSRNTQCNHKILHNIFKIPLNWLINGRIACGKDAGKWLFADKKFEVIHNGKDFSKFSYKFEKRKEIRNKLGLEDRFVIGHVGKFNLQKNHQFLIELFKKYSDLHPESILMLIGDGPLESEIKNNVSSLNLQDKVIFTGAIDNVQDYLQATDLMIFPSLFEGLPNVVLEWQAMGIPTLISDRITSECIVCNLVKVERLDADNEIWIKDIEEIRNNYPNREFSAQKGIASLKSKGFDITNCASKLTDYYIQLLEQQNIQLSS